MEYFRVYVIEDCYNLEVVFVIQEFVVIQLGYRTGSSHANLSFSATVSLALFTFAVLSTVMTYASSKKSDSKYALPVSRWSKIYERDGGYIEITSVIPPNTPLARASLNPAGCTRRIPHPTRNETSMSPFRGIALIHFKPAFLTLNHRVINTQLHTIRIVILIQLAHTSPSPPIPILAKNSHDEARNTREKRSMARDCWIKSCGVATEATKDSRMPLIAMRGI